MDIALIGYGKMGRAIEAMAATRGHRIVARIDKDDPWDGAAQADVAIEFSTPTAAAANVRRALEAGLPVVVGTTGWYDRLDEAEALCRQRGGSLFVASNFSIGMNIMFDLNERLARLMEGRTEYSPTIAETHHVHKLDAPSGTALTLAAQIKARLGREVPIASVREGEVPGTHTVTYDSPADTITLTHEAHSREGLALGALLAAEYLVAHRGIHTMKDLLG